MWSAISKIFAKNSSSSDIPSGEEPPDEMDRGERRGFLEADDTFITKQVCPILGSRLPVVDVITPFEEPAVQSLPLEGLSY